MNVLLICNYKPHVGGISGQVDLLRQHLRAESHKAEIFSTKTSILKRLLLPIRLRRKARQFDVLHIHCCSGWGFLPAVLGVAVGRQMKKRTVVTYHGGGAEAFFHQHPRLVHRTLTRTDVNIVLNGFLQKVFEQHHIPCIVIPNIVEFPLENYRQRSTIEPHFICTRAHEDLYNLPCILLAFKQVQDALPKSTLTLVGDGSLHSLLQQQAQEMGLRHVRFVGRVPNEAIPRLLDAADVLLSAPKVDNMPVSLLEAMNAGLLIISSRVGGVPYMVNNGHSGLLFESDNDADLARKMLWAIENPALALTIAQQGQRQADRYRWASVRTAILHAYGLSA